MARRASLFIVSLPRSLSSLLYHAIRRRLALRQPEWTTDGEILNLRRFALLPREGEIEGVRYLERDSDPERFRRLISFLDQAAQAEGFAYKDVVQPFLVAEWLARTPIPTLFFDRPVADVAFALIERGWLYPALAARGDVALPETVRPLLEAHRSDLAGAVARERIERALVSGLLRARRDLAAVVSRRVAYDELIHDEAPLEAALRTLYGEAGETAAEPLSYLDDEFRRRRDEVLDRRQTRRWRDLAALCAELEASAEAPQAPAQTQIQAQA